MVILLDSTSLARNESRIKYLKPGDWNSNCLLKSAVVSTYRYNSQQSYILIQNSSSYLNLEVI